MANRHDDDGLFFPKRLVEDPVISNAQLVEIRELSRQGFRLERVEVLGQPMQTLADTKGRNTVEALEGALRRGEDTKLVH
jgi:hypothetical protein